MRSLLCQQEDVVLSVGAVDRATQSVHPFAMRLVHKSCFSLPYPKAQSLEVVPTLGPEV